MKRYKALALSFVIVMFLAIFITSLDKHESKDLDIYEPLLDEEGFEIHDIRPITLFDDITVDQWAVLKTDYTFAYKIHTTGGRGQKLYTLSTNNIIGLLTHVDEIPSESGWVMLVETYLEPEVKALKNSFNNRPMDFECIVYDQGSYSGYRITIDKELNATVIKTEEKKLAETPHVELYGLAVGKLNWDAYLFSNRGNVVKTENEESYELMIQDLKVNKIDVDIQRVFDESGEVIPTVIHSSEKNIEDQFKDFYRLMLLSSQFLNVKTLSFVEFDVIERNINTGEMGSPVHVAFDVNALLG